MLDTTRFLLLGTRLKKRYEGACCPICKKYGLLQIDFDVLAFLHNNPGYDTARDIVELRALQKSNVSASVERLIEKGFLSRHPDPGDRRLIHLTLEQAAAGAAADIVRLQETMSRRLFAALSEQEQDTYRRLTDKLARSFEAEEGGEALC